MRVGDKVIPQTSRTWHPSSVGARVQAAPEPLPSGLSVRFMQVRTATIKLADALEILRDAFRAEADDEGQWTDAILDVQGNVNDALAGCGALMVGIREQQEQS